MHFRLLIIFTLLSPFFTQALDIKVHTLPVQSELRASAIKGDLIWVAGNENTIYKSLDKGKTWIKSGFKSNKKFDFRDIEIINNQTAIVMATGYGEDSALYITNDQGRNWRLLYQNTDKKGFFNSIAFVNSKLGFLMGDPVNEHFMLKRTKDGGETWHTIDMTHFPEIEKDEIAFAASGNTLITNRQNELYFATGGNQAAIYKYNYKTKTSNKIQLPLHSKGNTSGVYSVAFNSKNDLFALGGDYKQRQGPYENIVLADKNGTMVNQTINSGGLITAMQCAYNFCIAVGKSNSYISKNHGYQWQPLTSTSFEGFYTLAQSEGTFIAAGTQGKVAIITHGFQH
ncbi:WD40/YVTN/BNR-like repeat-containing protein [Pseudoalteromonas sp. SS15]|uniref:WD40/YVTN/BNR-like repeat-containing protein n=1 Tax=Pseudoalteromonas sp. SS15 TaxID=3139393 RepID=UPI003BACBE47